MVATRDPAKPEIDKPQPIPPVIEPTDNPVPEAHDEPPPETVNVSQEDEAEQAQSFTEAARDRDNRDPGPSDSTKVPSGNEEDDVQDLVDHMKDMLASGRIDMGAFRGERNDDDEEDSLGPDAAHE
jgi:outer membrane biosynthesis protein TonB